MSSIITATRILSYQIGGLIGGEDLRASHRPIMDRTCLDCYDVQAALCIRSCSMRCRPAYCGPAKDILRNIR
eukprot:scaffold588776_cov19-Prasinocladus_malaysianus.AAC.1